MMILSPAVHRWGFPDVEPNPLLKLQVPYGSSTCLQLNDGTHIW